MKHFKFFICLCCILGLLVNLTGCPKNANNADPKGKIYYSFFDTVSTVYSYTGDSEAQFDSNAAAVAKILEEYHQLFDIYYEYAGVNNLCSLNKQAGGEPMKVDQKLIDFLLYAEELYNTTNGEMNIMMGSVLRLWHDCREKASQDPKSARIPAEVELEEAGKHTGFSLLEIDEKNCTVRITDPEASIDVGALGKGYATEMAAKYLESKNISGYVLNIGGNIRIIGTKPDGSSWVTGIKDPQAPDTNYAYYINIADTSCVTSGDYERFFNVDGVRYHHIIDKDTYMPADFFSSITVLTKDSGLADALSTALFCMSYQDGIELINKLEGVEALWIMSDGTQYATDGFVSLKIER